jgi:putative oxidoreductase
MQQLEAAGAWLGRLLLAALFLHEAWAKITAYGMAVSYAEAFGVPGWTIPFAIAVELIGGIMLLAGYYTRAAALVLALFCIATAVLFHTKFGNRNELLHFEKDLAIAGGFLVLAARGGGPWALDAVLGPTARWPFGR